MYKKLTIFLILCLFFVQIPHCSAEISTEKIVIAINQSYAEKQQNWTQNTSDIINYINFVFSKNTNKQYEIVEFKTYNSFDLKNISTDKNYFWLNNQNNKDFATTIFLFNPVNEQEKQFSKQVFGQQIAQVKILQTFFDKPTQLHSIFVNLENKPEFYFYNLLLGQQLIDENYGQGTFSHSMQPIIHELGHTYGIGFPEFYLFENITGYELNQAFINDPMLSFTNIKQDYFFGQYSSYIINQNINHQQPLNFYKNNFAKQISIKVVDQNNTSLDSTLIEIYNHKNQLIDSTITDNNGIFVLNVDNDFHYINIQASYKNIKQKQIISMLDLQNQKTKNNQDVFETSFVFEKNTNALNTYPIVNKNFPFMLLIL